MNRKGFSLVELLAIITILGVIMGVAIVSHQKQVTRTRTEAYKNLITTIRTAAQNRYIDEGISGDICTKYQIEDLYTGGYMDKPSDPASNGSSCEGRVFIVPAEDDGDMENYNINVELKCSVYKTDDCKDSGGASCSMTEDEKSGCGLR